MGGSHNEPSPGNIDSTELFISGEWTTVGPLPAPMRAWQGLVTIANIVYIAGIEYYFFLLPPKYIVTMNASTLQVGRKLMEKIRLIVTQFGGLMMKRKCGKHLT